MANVESDRLYGTLNLLVLQTLESGPRHGLAVLRAIEEQAQTRMRIEEGALYPALHRLERDGCISGKWGLSETKRRAKFYELTPLGRRRLDSEVERWIDHTRAVAGVLGLQVAIAEGAPA